MRRSLVPLVLSLLLAVPALATIRVPKWATAITRTPHFLFQHAPGDPPDPAALAAMEAHYDFLAATFGIPMPAEIRYIKYPSAAAFQRMHPGFIGWTTPGLVESQRWFHPHETVHAVLWPDSEFLREGVAEAFGSPFQRGWQTTLPRWEMSYDRVRSALAQFTNDDRLMSREFVGWLYRRYGAGKMVKLMAMRGPSVRQVEEAFRLCYGQELRALVTQCAADYDWLRAQPDLPGSFVFKEGRRSVAEGFGGVVPEKEDHAADDREGRDRGA